MADLFTCNMNEFGVGRFNVWTYANAFFKIRSDVRITLGISMLTKNQHDKRLLYMFPDDYKSALIANGFPDFVTHDAELGTGDKHDYFGLDYVESFALMSSATLRGYVYNCFIWQQSRPIQKLGLRLVNDCFQLLNQTRDDWCQDFSKPGDYIKSGGTEPNWIELDLSSELASQKGKKKYEGVV